MKLRRTSDDKYVVEAVERALDILEAFRDSEEMTLNQVSQRVGFNKSRTFRLLYTLADRGYVERARDGSHYKLGMKLFEYATHFRRDLKSIAQPFMRQLHDRFNETINLGIIHSGEILYIDLLESSRPFRMAAMIGSRMPIESTSLGKAIMAFSPEHESEAFLTRLPANQSGKMRKELETVRKRGYSLDDEENEHGVACIGAAISDGRGTAMAAMSVSGSMARILEKEKEIGSALNAVCNEISKYMGFIGNDSGMRASAAFASLQLTGSRRL